VTQESTGESFQELYGQGTKLLHQNEPRKAAALLEKAYDLNPDHIDAALNLGGALILLGRFTSAVDVLEDITKREPNNPMAWTNLGAAYLGNPVLARDEQQLQAISAFRRALKIQATAPSVAYNIGLIYRDRHQWKRAAYWFQEALKNNPDDKDAEVLYRKMSDLLGEDESLAAE
jgi:tetratricopeptide (TPR) repeat protein